MKTSEAFMTDKLLHEMRGNTALITINNPAANTWDEESLQSAQIFDR